MISGTMASRRKNIKDELLLKSREAALLSIQCFNNPLILFRSEVFIVLNNIAWTYLMHAHYRKNKIDYRYYEKIGERKRYKKTARGAYKYWELEKCLNHRDCPLNSATCSNLKFLIGLRHEIEHQMTNRIDDLVSGKFQAACLNFNYYVKRLFGEKYGIDKYLTFSLQLSSIEADQARELIGNSDLPIHISSYLDAFEKAITEEDYSSPQYSYRMIFLPKLANQKGQADRVIEFIKADDPRAQQIDASFTVIREKEKTKFKPSSIAKMMKSLGYSKFTLDKHTKLWKFLDAKSDERNGISVEGTWFWYEAWIEKVK